MKRRNKLERRTDDGGNDTYWEVDPENGVGRKITWEEFSKEEAARGRRDIFAVGAMIGIMAGRTQERVSLANVVAIRAYEIADVMLQERELIRESE